MPSNGLPVMDIEDLSLEEAKVGLARPDEHDAFVRRNHCVEFRRFAGRGLQRMSSYAPSGAYGLANWRAPTAR